MTPREVSALLRKSLRQMARDRAAGKGPPFIPGPRPRYRQAAVMEWLAEQERGGERTNGGTSTDGN